MLKNLAIFSSLLLTFCVNAQSWVQLTDFPGTERDDATVFVIGNKAYCGLGYLPWFTPANDFYTLNFTNETWLPATSFPSGGERQYACGFSHSGYGYVFGGIDASGSFLNELWQYDTLFDAWNMMTALPSTGRSGSSCFVIGDTAYIIGGKTITEDATAEVWAYAILSDTWLQKSNFPNGGRWRAASAAVNSKGYVVFGIDSSFRYCTELYSFNQTTNTWTFENNFPGNGRTYSGMTNLYNDLYVTCGKDSLGTYYNQLWIYNVGLGTWSMLSSIPAAGRKGGLCFSSQNSIYYTTGINALNTRLKETWRIYNPTAVNDVSHKLSVKIFPNPATENISISTSFNQFHVKIFASNGQTVYSYLNPGSSLSIDVSLLKTGLYNIYISDGIKTITEKIIINPQHE